MRNLNEIFRKDVAYDNFKSYKKPGFHPLFRRYNFRKTTGGGGGVKLTSPPPPAPPAVLGLTAFSRFLFCKKSSIIDVRLFSKYASKFIYNLLSTIWKLIENKYSWKTLKPYIQLFFLCFWHFPEYQLKKLRPLYLTTFVILTDNRELIHKNAVFFLELVITRSLFLSTYSC